MKAELVMLTVFMAIWIPTLIVAIAIFIDIRKKRKYNPIEEMKKKMKVQIKREILEKQLREEIRTEIEKEKEQQGNI